MSDATFPCDAQPFFINGPAGPIEALATCPTTEAVAATAVILHPHPLYGGTMQNKVVHTLARAFDGLGLRTVRFNFRGVGRSAGAHTGGAGEIEDALAVLTWVRTCRPDDQIWIAGFSFGAYIAFKAQARFPVTLLVTVAPPVHLYDFASLPAPRVPWWVLQGDQDEVVSADAVFTWADRFDPRPDVVRFEGSSHFFHQRLNDLRNVLITQLTSRRP